MYVDSGIKAPTGSGIQFTNAFTRFLNGKGGVSHILNSEGGASYSGSDTQYLCGLHSEHDLTLPEVNEPLEAFL